MTEAITTEGQSTLSVVAAIAVARSAVADLTGQPIDTVAHCARQGEGAWSVAIDVIESPARMGDNDLLATYEVEIDHAGALISYRRSRRYHREDQDI